MCCFNRRATCLAAASSACCSRAWGPTAQRAWTVAAILGLRSGRDGFSQITVTGGADDVAGAARDRRDPPFAPVMDGGGEAGFKSVTTAGELLHLAHLALISAAE